MQHDIVAVLEENHDRLIELAGSLRACPRPQVAMVQFNEFAVLLGAHLGVMKRVVYPALKSIGWKDVSSTVLLGHAKLTQAFAEVLTLKKANGAFADALGDLLEATAWLVAQERSALLPLLQKNLTDGTRLAMAAEASNYVPRTSVTTSWSGSDFRRQSARDWIEAARLLLGAMQADDVRQEPTP
jgi:hypothetical protein